MTAVNEESVLKVTFSKKKKTQKSLENACQHSLGEGFSPARVPKTVTGIC